MAVSTRWTLRSCVIAAVLAPRALAGQQLSATERGVAVATIWAEARFNYAYWDHVRSDWDSALAANLKLAAEPQSDLVFYHRLRRLIALLGDGQAAVIAPPQLRSRIARPPLLLEAIERRPFILDYAENDEMRVARPMRLSEIIAVQGIPAEAWIRDSVLPEIPGATAVDRWMRAVAWMLEGEKGTSLHLLVRVPDGEPRGLSVTRSLSLNDRWPLDPPAFALDTLPGGIAVVHIASFNDAEAVRQVDLAFPDFGRVQGMVLDLRRATGGRIEYAYQILARLTDHSFPAVRWRTPEYRAVFRAWNLTDSAFAWYGMDNGTVTPRNDRPTYAGPLTVLASNATSGAAEDLLAAFKAAGRGVIVGEPSAGSAGDVATFALPKSWGVQFSVSRHQAPDGTEFAGIGIKPDNAVLRTANDLLAGKDAALERAMEYLQGGKPARR